jgi:acyl-lipid omega-6 desaturase (Delta-12 desaturase)
VYLSALRLTASIDVWLFDVRHQFEVMTRRDGESWRLHETALHGSSHYDLLTVLRWITG